MHPAEFGNAADSSKILLKTLPGSSLFVFGVLEEERALAGKISLILVMLTMMLYAL